MPKSNGYAASFILGCLLLFAFVLSAGRLSFAGECDSYIQFVQSPVVSVLYHGSNHLVDIVWLYNGSCTDVYHIYSTHDGVSGAQIDVRLTNNCSNVTGHPCSYELAVDPNVTYTFQVQGCTTHIFRSDSCTQWSPKSVLSPYGSDVCKMGFVWRDAVANDHVCVLSVTRQQAADDNQQAAARRAGSGAYGPDTCKQGFVWRGATPGDHVCVLPVVRDATAEDNAKAASRKLQGSF